MSMDNRSVKCRLGPIRRPANGATVTGSAMKSRELSEVTGAVADSGDCPALWWPRGSVSGERSRASFAADHADLAGARARARTTPAWRGVFKAIRQFEMEATMRSILAIVACAALSLAAGTQRSHA